MIIFGNVYGYNEHVQWTYNWLVPSDDQTWLARKSIIDDFPHLRAFTEDVLIKPSIEFSIATLD